MKNIIIEVKVKMILSTKRGIKVDDVINEMDYRFVSLTTGAQIVDTEILDYEIKDTT